MKRAIVAIWLLSLCSAGYTQLADTTLVLPEFEKLEYKFEQAQALTLVSKVDSNTLDFNRAGTITEILENTSTLFVRNYGPGYSATVSQRGLATAHTPIYWNGLNLNSPTTGVGDVSLIPAAFIQSIAIVHGGVSAATGSGTIAGAIYLNPDKSADREKVFASLGFRYTNIQNAENSLIFRIFKNGWKFNSSILINDSQNRFNYVNHAHRDKPIETRKNSAFNQQGWLQEIEKQIGKHSLQLAFWGVETDRQLAPGLTSSDNQERQNDVNLKAAITAHLNFRNSFARLQTAWIRDELNYSNASAIQSDIRSQQWVLNADFRHKFGKSTVLNYGTSNSFQMALASGNYSRTEEQLALAAYIGLDQSFYSNKFNVSIMLRQEHYQRYQSPFSPALTLNYKILSWLSMVARGSRNYRIPGLNDRFWLPGGDPNLPAERAWVADIGSEFKLMNLSGKNELRAQVFGFLHQIENWIQWIPGPDFWRAVSYKSVRSTGIQSELNWSMQLKTWNLKANVSHVYVNSKNLESSFNHQIQGTTLTHVPSNNLFTNITITRNKTMMLLDGNYTGSRFTSSDNLIEQPEFMIINIGLGREVLFKSFGANLKFRVHNLLNTDYQVMPWMPMPLRHYSISVHFNFQAKLKSKS
jgi:vitamin B12 transporter